jgi:hypothetical protein
VRSLLLAVALFLVSRVSAATPQPLPFTYVYETLPKGSLEVEQYIDYTPVTAISASTGNAVRYGATQFQTEFEYGITDRLELGLYAILAPAADASTYAQAPSLSIIEGTGLKERLRLRLGEAGQWPVDVALYGELVETEDEFELEAKVILQRRIGDARLVANLWAEREWEYVGTQDWVINPTLGFTYQVTPSVHPGIESWLHAEWPDPTPAARTFNLGPVAYVGPTLMLNFGKLWWAVGEYMRVTEVDHVLAKGVDVFGKVWLRTIIGLSF